MLPSIPLPQPIQHPVHDRRIIKNLGGQWQGQAYNPSTLALTGWKNTIYFADTENANQLNIIGNGVSSFGSEDIPYRLEGILYIDTNTLRITKIHSLEKYAAPTY